MPAAPHDPYLLERLATWHALAGDWQRACESFQQLPDLPQAAEAQRAYLLAASHSGRDAPYERLLQALEFRTAEQRAELGDVLRALPEPRAIELLRRLVEAILEPVDALPLLCAVGRRFGRVEHAVQLAGWMERLGAADHGYELLLACFERHASAPPAALVERLYALGRGLDHPPHYPVVLLAALAGDAQEFGEVLAEARRTLSGPTLTQFLREAAGVVSARRAHEAPVISLWVELCRGYRLSGRLAEARECLDAASAGFQEAAAADDALARAIESEAERLARLTG